VTAVDSLARYALRGGLPKLIFILGLLSGTIALLYTPREEELQIVVPMVDVMVQAPGLSARQVERQVTTPLAALVPRPRLSLTRFHGVFAPNFKHRKRIVPHRSRRVVDSDSTGFRISWHLPKLGNG